MGRVQRLNTFQRVLVSTKSEQVDEPQAKAVVLSFLVNEGLSFNTDDDTGARLCARARLTSASLGFE
jgi:hypothetical protein